MQLNNINVTATLRARYVSGGEEQWDKILDLLANTADGKLLRGFSDVFFFKLANGELFGKNIQEDLAISDVLLGEGDGTTTDFNFSYGVTPVKPSTVQIKYTIGGTEYTATDDGSGNISGSEITSGTIDYNTGDISLTFNTAPDADTPIKYSFTRGIADDDTLAAGFTFVLGTDENPTLADAAFSNTATITTTPSIVDWYETETEYVYKVTMTGTYTEATASDKITGVGIIYQGIKGTCAGTSSEQKYILKSIAPNRTDLFGANGLILQNETDLIVEFTITVRK